MLSRSRVSTSASSANTSLSSGNHHARCGEKQGAAYSPTEEGTEHLIPPHTQTPDVFLILNPLLKQGYEGLSLEVREPQNKDSLIHERPKQSNSQGRWLAKIHATSAG